MMFLKTKCIKLKGKFVSHMIKRENYTGIVLREKQTWLTLVHYKKKKKTLPRVKLWLSSSVAFANFDYRL